MWIERIIVVTCYNRIYHSEQKLQWLPLLSLILLLTFNDAVFSCIRSLFGHKLETSNVKNIINMNKNSQLLSSHTWLFSYSAPWNGIEKIQCPAWRTNLTSADSNGDFLISFIAIWFTFSSIPCGHIALQLEQ